MYKVKQIKVGSILTSEVELRDLAKAWIAISLAFGIILSGRTSLYSAIIISSLTVGVGFLFHELGHKLMAQKYGCFAEFRSFDQMLVLAVIMALFFRVVFAAPGAVMISGPVGKRRNGKISAAGPAVNLVLALLFFALLFVFVDGILKDISYYGFMINTWLALFNMLPFGNFDGRKILVWNKAVYGVMVGVAVVFMFMQGVAR